MREQPLISVVIPCFNDERHLGDAIRSALEQTYPHVEVIVVDDGSTDESVSVAQSFGDRVTVLRKRNGGPASARNVGMHAARGAFVTFLDSDDILLPEFLSKTAAVLAADPSLAFVYVQLEHFGAKTGRSDFPEFDVQRLTKGNYLRPTALLRADRIRGVEFDERLRSGWEDWDYFLTLSERSERGRLLDEPLMLYRKHPQGERLSDLMVEARNKRRVFLYIMRKHRRLFGWRRYGHYLGHHVKETLKGSFTRSPPERGG